MAKPKVSKAVPGEYPRAPKMGRPRAQINWDDFEKLCKMQCTTTEIASFLEISQGTLYDRTKEKYEQDFSTIYKRFAEGGKASLRTSQWRLAQKNTAMAIWLGKIHLGQKDPDKQNAPDQANAHQFLQLLGMLSNGAIPTDLPEKLARLEELEAKLGDQEFGNDKETEVDEAAEASTSNE